MRVQKRELEVRYLHSYDIKSLCTLHILLLLSLPCNKSEIMVLVLPLLETLLSGRPRVPIQRSRDATDPVFGCRIRLHDICKWKPGS